jgi:hypothetical protein
MAEVRPRAAVLATIGAAGLGASAYFVWLTNRAPELIPLRKLLFVGEVAGDAPSYWQSMAAPLVVISALGLLGALVLSRLILLIGFLLGLTTLGLWIATDLLEVEGGISLDKIGTGVWVNLGSLLVLLVGLIALRRGGEEDEDEDDEFSPTPFSPKGFGDD